MARTEQEARRNRMFTIVEENRCHAVIKVFGVGGGQLARRPHEHRVGGGFQRVRQRGEGELAEHIRVKDAIRQ